MDLSKCEGNQRETDAPAQCGPAVQNKKSDQVGAPGWLRLRSVPLLISGLKPQAGCGAYLTKK